VSALVSLQYCVADNSQASVSLTDTAIVCSCYVVAMIVSVFAGKDLNLCLARRTIFAVLFAKVRKKTYTILLFFVNLLTTAYLSLFKALWQHQSALP
jgi:hypothetical protein